MKLEEYQTAQTALETGASLAEDKEKSRFVNLIKECEKLIAGESFILFVDNSFYSVKIVLFNYHFFWFTFGDFCLS